MEFNTYIIILNYNGWKDTLECIESLVRNRYHVNRARIIIVDNNSSDDSVNNIVDWFKDREDISFDTVEYEYNKELKKIDISKQFILIKSKTNDGYASGNNIGIKYALKDINARYIWVLNNDVIVENECLENLEHIAEENSDYGVIGSLIMEYYDKSKIQCLGGCKYNYLTATSKPLYSNKMINDLNDMMNKKLNIDYISGCSMFFRRDTLENIGLLNEDYFLYFEEIDYSKRMKKSNYKLGICKDSIIYHKGGASIGSSNIVSKKSTFSEYNSNISALKFTKKYYKNMFLFIMINRFILKHVKFIVKNELYLFKPLYKSYLDFFKDTINSKFIEEEI